MIQYDQPIQNLIADLSATGHVTHSSFPKYSVTVHHNGGVRNTHNDVLNTWRTREASAHFDIDVDGSVAQYVEVNEYAWATGNTDANDHSISIEHADVDTNWTISEATLNSSARLIGWLFAHYIAGTPRPSTNNVFPHQHWYATACPGPDMMKKLGVLILKAGQWYDYFKSGHPQTKVQILQQALKTSQDGVWGPATDMGAMGMRNCASLTTNSKKIGDFNVQAVQHILGNSETPLWKPEDQTDMANWVGIVQGAVLSVKPDKVWGPVTDEAFMALRAANLRK